MTTENQTPLYRFSIKDLNYPEQYVYKYTLAEAMEAKRWYSIYGCDCGEIEPPKTEEEN